LSVVDRAPRPSRPSTRTKPSRRKSAVILLAVSLLIAGVVTGVVGVALHSVVAANGAAAAAAAASAPAAGAFATPQYFPRVTDDTFYNTVDASGDIIATANDSTGVDRSCTTQGSDIAILKMTGSTPTDLDVSTVNCLTSFGPRGGGNAPDGCSWKSGGITRVGGTIYLSVARQLKQCSYGREIDGLQPSFNASIMKSTDGGRTWTNPWGTTSATGAAPPWISKLNRYKAMFPGQAFAAPFFIQYGPGNTQTVDGGDKYLYAVSTGDSYSYNGSYLHLARVPLNKIQQPGAWQFYHGRVGGTGQNWTSSITGATRVLQAPHDVSQPAIQYVPALKRYVLLSFSFTHGSSDFPNRRETPYTQLHFFTSPKPWGPWTQVFEHSGQRSLWCTSSPCPLNQDGGSAQALGSPADWLGLYDTALVQKFVFTNPLAEQAIFTCGDWKNAGKYPGERLNRLHVIPLDLASLLGS
jgi:hypothetical protein